MKKSWVCLGFLLLATFGWMSMLELAEGSAIPTGCRRRVSRSVRDNNQSQLDRLSSEFRVCESRVHTLLRRYCVSIGGDSDLPGVGDPESPNNSNIVDDCCNSCCTVQQFQSYCNEFPSTSPVPTPPRQEPTSFFMRLIVGIVRRVNLRRGDAESPKVIPDQSQTLQALEQHRPHQRMPTESQLQVEGENTSPTESGYILYR